MWARISTFVFPPDDLEHAERELNRGADLFRDEAGLVRMEVFLNRKTGAAVSVSVWETEAAMKASDEHADEVRREIAVEVMAWVKEVHEYELIRTEPAGK
jgi:heme-degrading monooxygenase HmoA